MMITLNLNVIIMKKETTKIHTAMSYAQLTQKQAPSGNYFFAFSNTQLAEGIKKITLKEGEKILKAPGGMFGTKQAIDDFFKFYEDLEKEIAEKCTPQEVYAYEFNNHECSYVGDDERAIEIVIRTFGKEKAKTVKRRFACISIDKIKED